MLVASVMIKFKALIKRLCLLSFFILASGCSGVRDDAPKESTQESPLGATNEAEIDLSPEAVTEETSEDLTPVKVFSTAEDSANWGFKANGWILADDFQIEQRSSIDSMKIKIYTFDADRWNNQIEYFIYSKSDMNLPGELLESGEGQEVESIFVGTTHEDSSSGPRYWYEVSFTFEVGFEAKVNTSYWLGLRLGDNLDSWEDTPIHWAVTDGPDFGFAPRAQHSAEEDGQWSSRFIKDVFFELYSSQDE